VALRAALITGGGSGIGRATAVRLAGAGYAVAVSGRRIQPLEQTAALAGVKVVPVAGDITHAADAERMVAATVDAFGRLDVLVNNAGTIDRGPLLHELPAERWDEQLSSNLRGAFLVTRAALRTMLDGEGDRVVVNVASSLAQIGAPGVAAYSAAKGGLVALTRAVAIEYGARGIRCNCVCPHIVDTDLAKVGRRSWQELLDTAPERYPVGRIGRPDDVAAAIEYLASPQAEWVTGAVLVVDGGITAA